MVTKKEHEGSYLEPAHTHEDPALGHLQHGCGLLLYYHPGFHYERLSPDPYPDRIFVTNDDPLF
jgi:hypothetical protein